MAPMFNYGGGGGALDDDSVDEYDHWWGVEGRRAIIDQQQGQPDRRGDGGQRRWYGARHRYLLRPRLIRD
jgi:hypothetical protein